MQKKIASHLTQNIVILVVSFSISKLRPNRYVIKVSCEIEGVILTSIWKKKKNHSLSEQKSLQIMTFFILSSSAFVSKKASRQKVLEEV